VVADDVLVEHVFAFLPRRGGRPRALTPEQETTILDRFLKGEPASDLAAEFNVSLPTLYKCVAPAFERR